MFATNKNIFDLSVNGLSIALSVVMCIAAEIVVHLIALLDCYALQTCIAVV